MHSKSPQWKEKFKQEGRNALQNLKISHDESKRFNWQSITRTILNQQAPEHNILVKPRENPEESASKQYHQFNDQNQVQGNLRKSTDQRNLNGNQSRTARQTLMKPVLFEEDEGSPIFPDKMISLRQDIDKLVAESSQSRKYFERFKREREERLEAMKMKNQTLQKVNIDDAVFGNNYGTSQKTIANSTLEDSDKVIVDTEEVEKYSQNYDHKFVRNKSILYGDKAYYKNDYPQSRSSLSNYKYENSVKYKAQQELNNYFQSFEKLSFDMSNRQKAKKQINFPLIYNSSRDKFNQITELENTALNDYLQNDNTNKKIDYFNLRQESKQTKAF
eukprot:403334647